MRAFKVLEAALNQKPKHFSYPYAACMQQRCVNLKFAEELGFETAVTTRPGILYAEHRNYLHALPRVSLNGDYQAIRYLRRLCFQVYRFMFGIKFKKINVV